MLIAKVTLKSVCPYSQSKAFREDKNDKESSGDFEKRTWRARCHVDGAGYLFIPPMQFKQCLSDAASYLNMKIKGQGKATWKKNFLAGIMVSEPLKLPISVDDVQGETIFVPSDGKKGGGQRVYKTFPVIPSWSGEVTFYILDETITKEVFEYHLREAGKFIGLGRFRPRNGGFYGRFEVVSIQWSKQ